LRNRLAGTDTIFIRQTSICKYTLTFTIGVFAAHHNLVSLRIFDATHGINGDQSPGFFDLFRNVATAHWLHRNEGGRKCRGSDK
jgi:hypothetical protein